MMFDNWQLRPLSSQPVVDVYQIIREAQARWLRPIEVVEILRNQHIFRLNSVPPNKPPSGSLFLFDRKTLRFFRKDGHNWRKKKDGKTVREAHERLKAGSIDILHCYYAHGEGNINFQRRSYWMLEGAYEHIVLVHYREVTEGSRACTFRTVNDITDDGQSQTILSTQTPRSESLPLSNAFSGAETSEAEVTGPYQSPESITESVLPEVEGNISGDEAEEGIGPVLGAFKEHHSSLLQQLSSGHGEDKCMNNGDTLKEWPSFANPSLWAGHNAFLHSAYSPLETAVTPNGGPDLLQRSSIGIDKQVSVHPSVADLQNGHTFQLEGRSQNPERLLGQQSLSSATFDISGWNKLLENFRGSQSLQYGAHVVSAANIGDAWVSQSGHRGQVTPSVTAPKVGTPMASRISHACNSVGNAENQALHDRPCEEEHLPTSKEMFSNQSDLRMSNQKPRQEFFGEHNHDEELRSFQQEQNLSINGGMDSQVGTVIPSPPLALASENADKCRVGGSEPLKKLDSFGRWMSHEMGEDSEVSFRSASNYPGPYWGTSLDCPDPAELISHISERIQMDAGLSPSLAQEQRFSINDYSPEWAFSSGRSKVVIVGNFLDKDKKILESAWCCMFGEVEVPAEVIQPGVFRCEAPPHEPGRVPFYITCGDRLACSEIREFEYSKQGPAAIESSFSRSCDRLETSSPDVKSASLLVRFAKMLCCRLDEHLPMRDLRSSNGLTSVETVFHATSKSDEELMNLVTIVKNCQLASFDVKDHILQIFLKQKLHSWLLSKGHGHNKGVCAYDDEGQGVLHLAAALGYEWAVAPILAAGVGVNFRDQHGWTALHWAAIYGREKVVLALLAAGAAPGLLTDPTPKYPSGRTPADLAASSGHGGMAGYLAEMSLTSHLSSLALKEKNIDEIEAFSATLAEEKAIDYVSERTIVQKNIEKADERITIQGSLRAVRNAARAAALIQATFRRHSFCKRQQSLELEVLEDHSMSQEEIKSMMVAQKIQKAYPGHRKEVLHSAAVQIQCKFRSWKGRKDFLSLRQRVVKIQAHVRGHQVRTKCRKLVWSVGILEKVVLRWRRKGTGLRGFRADSIYSSNLQHGIDSDGDEDVLKAGRREKEIAIQNAVARVQIMAKSDEARAQYWRLAEGYRQCNAVEDCQLTNESASNNVHSSGRDEDFIMFGEN